MAPGDSAVCPTSTTTRKAALSQAERGNFLGGPPGPSAHAQCHALWPSSSAGATRGPTRGCKSIPNSPPPAPPRPSPPHKREREQTELVLTPEPLAPPP